MENMTQDMQHMTRDMRRMTEDMNEVARRTKTETVSMRIITLVTLFFLPGTFISVGCFLFIILVSPSVAGTDCVTAFEHFIRNYILSSCCEQATKKMIGSVANIQDCRRS